MLRVFPNFTSSLQLKVIKLLCVLQSLIKLLWYSIGPKQHMLVDFWRLIWQERPPSIVMVTNLKEGNKKKCEQYWPDSGSTTYGPFKVTLTENQVFANFTIRTLQVIVSCKIQSLALDGAVLSRSSIPVQRGH